MRRYGNPRFSELCLHAKDEKQREPEEETRTKGTSAMTPQGAHGPLLEMAYATGLTKQKKRANESQRKLKSTSFLALLIL